MTKIQGVEIFKGKALYIGIGNQAYEAKVLNPPTKDVSVFYVSDPLGATGRFRCFPGDVNRLVFESKEECLKAIFFRRLKR